VNEVLSPVSSVGEVILDIVFDLLGQPCSRCQGHWGSTIVADRSAIGVAYPNAGDGRPPL